MRRLISILTVALIMALMAAVMAVPAFAQGSPCGEFVPAFAQTGELGQEASQEAGPGFGQFVSGVCRPAR